MSENEYNETIEDDEKRPTRIPVIIRGTIKSDSHDGKNEASENWFRKLSTKIQTEIRHEYNEDTSTN